jgi:outer membrane immunogenic protein
MNLVFLSTAALAVVAIASQVAAADLPARAPAYAKAPRTDPIYDWSGFYVGANGGYGFDHQSVGYTPNDDLARAFVDPVLIGAPAGTRIATTDALHERGGFGGIQGGYSWKLSGRFIAGIEADFDGASIHGRSDATHPFLTTSPLAIPLSFALNQKLDWFGTLRGRVGFNPASNWLLFASGGLAYGHVTESAVITAANSFSAGNGVSGANCPAGTPCYVATGAHTLAGWAAGVGAEYALTRNVTMRAEYLHIDLGKSSLTSSFPNRQANLLTSSATTNFSPIAFDTVRVGVNYHFN